MCTDKPYCDMPDEQLIQYAREGDKQAEEALYAKYKRFIRVRANSYFLIGADRDDIIQEGMIGLYKAIRDYDPAKSGIKQASFKSFAELCVTRQILSAIKSATRQKHIPLNSYVSLSKPVYSPDTERTFVDVLSCAALNPEETVIGRELSQSVAKHLKENLSPLERDALAYYLNGRSYAQIAQALNKDQKAIDNALQRVKHKIDRLMGEFA